MIAPFSTLDRLQTLEAILRRIEQLSNEDLWDLVNIRDMLKEENTRLGLKSKVFNTVLRHALTGMKHGPSVAETMTALGNHRTLVRLRTAHSITMTI